MAARGPRSAACRGHLGHGPFLLSLSLAAGLFSSSVVWLTFQLQKQQSSRQQVAVTVALILTHPRRSEKPRVALQQLTEQDQVPGRWLVGSLESRPPGRAGWARAGEAAARRPGRGRLSQGRVGRNRRTGTTNTRRRGTSKQALLGRWNKQSLVTAGEEGVCLQPASQPAEGREAVLHYMTCTPKWGLEGERGKQRKRSAEFAIAKLHWTG